MPAVIGDIDEPSPAAGGAPHPAEPFELATLLRRCMDDRSLAAGLVTTFTSRLAAIVKHIECLLTEKNWSLAAAKVHELKGEAGSLAAIELQTTAGVLEQCLRAQCAEEAPAHFLPLKLAADECISARSAIVRRLGQ
jgi:HPt (histidine-containing phosphotransfer) domain-containing protein